MSTQSNSRKIPLEKFPDQPAGGGATPPATIENVRYLFEATGHKIQFDVLKKELLVRDSTGRILTPATLVSLAVLNGIAQQNLPMFIEEIGKENPVNPVADWINSKPWDGTGRIEDFTDCVTAVEGYPENLKRQLLRRWLISLIAACFEPTEFKNRGVLTFQGGQGIGKTSFVASLLPEGDLRKRYIKLDHQIDNKDKDSILGAISNLIVEIGELDGTFRRGLARFKGFLTNPVDKVRAPYGKHVSEHQRRTVFAASVNEEQFLVDQTGNTRFWTIPVTALNYEHEIDLQQLYAEVKELWSRDEQWWLTKEEEAQLNEWNKAHEQVSAVEEAVYNHFEPIIERRLNHRARLTAIEVLERIGWSRPTNGQCKDCARALRSLFGEPKRIQGRYRYEVPVESAMHDGSPMGRMLAAHGLTEADF